MSDRIGALHHITLCTGSAQGDADFFYKTLGMSVVKKTLLYDGVVPIYHLYFGNATGDPGTLTTTFPFRQDGRKCIRGAGQIEVCCYSVPRGAAPYWKERLTERGVAITREYERFGSTVVQFRHPDCNLLFEVIEDERDTRKPFVGGGIPPEYALRGFHNWTVLEREADDMDRFMTEAWNYEKLASDGDFVRFKVGDGAPGSIIDIRLQPDVRSGSWFYGEGAVHHGAFDCPSFERQHAIKLELEGMGLTDVSERKDRGYFESVYVRTPAGALFEAAVTKGFHVDEPADRLGQEFMVSPQFRDQRDELIASMNDPFVLA